MHEMVKGANVGLAGLSENVDSVSVTLGWASSTGEGDADVSVMLLGEHGKVRGDSDFYFYNNPVAADGSVQLLGKKPAGEGSEDQIVFDLTAIPADVERIVVAASRYEDARFGELDDLRVTLADGSGEGLLRFAIDDAGSVSAFIFGELYRRAGEWKFRAVGQGYDTGLAGLATDFGVDIDDDAGEDDDTGEETGTTGRGTEGETGAGADVDEGAGTGAEGNGGAPATAAPAAGTGATTVPATSVVEQASPAAAGLPGVPAPRSPARTRSPPGRRRRPRAPVRPRRRSRCPRR